MGQKLPVKPEEKSVGAKNIAQLLELPSFPPENILDEKLQLPPVREWKSDVVKMK
jgi:hypothetical protein